MSGNTGEADMNSIKMVAIVLLVAGALGLIYGGFSYTKDTTAVKLGPLELSVKEKEQVNIPLWAGIAAMVAGGALLLTAGKRS
jgi:Na+/H+ antiporter NhaC